jgi:hypothetical protein
MPEGSENSRCEAAAPAADVGFGIAQVFLRAHVGIEPGPGSLYGDYQRLTLQVRSSFGRWN